jgi:hypothetical protein
VQPRSSGGSRFGKLLGAGIASAIDVQCAIHEVEAFEPSEYMVRRIGFRVSHHGKLQPPNKWITLPVEPIVDAKTYALVKELCEQRRPTELPGRASATGLRSGAELVRKALHLVPIWRTASRRS